MQEYRSAGRTIIMTTHDLGVARAFCSKLLFLNRRAIAYGTPKETFTPEVLQKTYGGHILRLSKETTLIAPQDESLMVLIGDTHHDVERVRGEKH